MTASSSHETISHWIESRKTRAESWERLRLQVLDAVFHALEVLSAKYPWEDAYVFGSLIRAGRFTPSSDVDVALRGLNKFSHYALIGELSSLIDRPVDVVRLEDLNDSSLIESIVTKGMRWQKKETSSSS